MVQWFLIMIIETDPERILNLIGAGFALYVPLPDSQDQQMYLLWPPDRPRTDPSLADRKCDGELFEILGLMARRGGSKDFPGWRSLGYTKPGRYIKFLQ
jgi:hypothetical protein